MAKAAENKATENKATEKLTAKPDDDTGPIPVPVDQSDAGTTVDSGPDANPDPDSFTNRGEPAQSSRAALVGAALRARLPRMAAALQARLPRLGAALRARLPRLSVTVVAGVLVCLSYPPFDCWYAAIIAFALLGWVVTRESITLIGGLGYGFLFGLAFYVPLLPWTGQLVGPVPYLGLAVMSAVFPGLFCVLAVLVRRLPGWPVTFAALWVAQEWLKSTVPFGGFPWGVVGFGQTDGPLLPIAHIGGAPLLSFAVVLTGFCVAAISLEVGQWWRHGHGHGHGHGVRIGSAAQNSAAPPEVVLPGVCICLVLIATAAIWPQVHRSGAGAGDDPTVTVAAVQGNVPRLGLDFNAQRRAVLDYHVRETIKLADDVAAGRAQKPQLVIWPENSSDIDPLTNPDAAEQISVAAQSIGAPILVGTVLARPDWTPDKPASSNSVIVWDPVTGPGEQHDKQIVQPFGEYLPWRGFFRHFSSYADRAGYFVPGTGTGVVHAAGVPVGITTCWEVIFDRAARESVLNGAQLLAVPTNNALFGDSMSRQQLAFARERAVEHDRYVVVAGTTGISAVIAPDGRELARTGFFQPAYLDNQIRLKTDLTPATRWGPIMQWVLISIGVCAAIVAILHNRGSVRPTRRGRPATDASAPPGGSGAQTPPEGGGRHARPDEGSNDRGAR
jgi:apolipoprotein N-acyltransferase